MGRLFVLLGILLLLAFAPMRMARGNDAQTVFFSLLFPELMPGEESPSWLTDWLNAAGEAVAL